MFRTENSTSQEIHPPVLEKSEMTDDPTYGNNDDSNIICARYGPGTILNDLDGLKFNLHSNHTEWVLLVSHFKDGKTSA